MLRRYEPAELIIQLIDEIKRGHGRLMSLQEIFIAAGEPGGLARTVMTAVVLAPSPPTVPQIARSLGYPRQTIQRQAQLLEAQGLVAFVDNPDHKRARRLVASPTAKKMHEASSRRSLIWAGEFAAGIDPQELRCTVELLRKVRKRLEAGTRAQKGTRSKGG